MIPRWHIVLGLLFSILIWTLVPETPLLFLALVFLSSFLIDFDHYAASLIKTKKMRLRDSFEYHRQARMQEENDLSQGIRRKSDFHLFHTIEFHALVGLFGLLWTGFFYIFIGMMFHSILDMTYLLHRKSFHRREYFFFNWLRRKI